MKNKKMLLVGGTLALLLGAFTFGTYSYNKSEKERVEALAHERSQLFVRDHSPVLGSDSAKVTLVEFLDPECESCRMFYPLVKDLLVEFEGKVRLVIRYAPFHHNSDFAVRLLEAARKQDLYWEALEVFFKNQPTWGDHHAPKPELLWSYLKDVGVDVEKVKNEINDPAIEKLIQQDLADGKKLGVRRTPAFFANGKPLQRFGLEELRQLIKSEL